MIENSIESKLLHHMMPEYLKIINESDQHHSGLGKESHFKITIVSSKFEGLRLIQRHRLVYDIVSQELALSVHALALHTYTPKEWACLSDDVPASPLCHKRSF